MNLEEIIIIGAGPAGIASAIQLKRYGYNPLIFEMNEFGGLLLNANRIDNYPGFPNGISGINLVKLFRKHFERFGIKLYNEKVIDIDYQDDLFIITTNRRVVRAKKIIIATGTVAKTVDGLEILPSASNKVFYEITKILYKENKKIAIVGGGDAAFDYALNLARKNTVYIFNHSSKIMALQDLADECFANTKINYFPNSIIKKVNIKDDLLLLDCVIDNNCQIFSIDYFVVAIGRKPYLDFLNMKIKQFKEELISAKRLFFIGDVINGDYRQASISVADGIRTAMQISKME